MEKGTVVVVVVMTSPSGAAYIGPHKNMGAHGRQMSRRDEEFHQTLIVLEHICDVNRITKVTLAFCCPFWAEHSRQQLANLGSPEMLCLCVLLTFYQSLVDNVDSDRRRFRCRIYVRRICQLLASTDQTRWWNFSSVYFTSAVNFTVL